MTFKSEFGATDLQHGCLLATVAHAIFTAGHPDLAYEQSWDGSNYNVQDSQGSLGTVSFAEDAAVGAFFDSNSRRNPSSSGFEYDVEARLAEMPAHAREIAERETLQYLLQDYKDKVVPIITAAFWSEGGFLVAAEPWEEVLSNGGHLIQTQLQPAEKAIQAWRGYYGLSSEAVELLQRIASQKIAAKGTPITLEDQDNRLFRRQGADGIEKSREILADIGIRLLL